MRWERSGRIYFGGVFRGGGVTGLGSRVSGFSWVSGLEAPAGAKRQPPRAAGAPARTSGPLAGLPRQRAELGCGRVAGGRGGLRLRTVYTAFKPKTRLSRTPCYTAVTTSVNNRRNTKWQCCVTVAHVFR